MEKDNCLTYTDQIYKLDVSFFSELRKRILYNGREWRWESSICAFSAVDGSLWLDMHSFEKNSCRFRDCASSSASLLARHAAEKAQRVSRFTPEAKDTSDCRCRFVTGTLIVYRSLSDFRSVDIKQEAENAYGSISFGTAGDLCIFGTSFNHAIWCKNDNIIEEVRLRSFLMICYVDVKACKCHFYISSPIVKPRVPWLWVSRIGINLPSGMESSEEKKDIPFGIDNEVIAKIFDYLNCSQPRHDFFALCISDGGIHFFDVCQISSINGNSLYVGSNECSYRDLILCGVGELPKNGALPRHWCTALLAILHMLKLCNTIVNLMVIDTNVLGEYEKIKEGNMVGNVAMLHRIRLGPCLISADDVTINYGYKVNMEYSLMKAKKHEHIVEFKDSSEDGAEHKVDAELHLHLMKWRIQPMLDLKKITDLRICIVGAGAVGCQVIRQLLAWGVSHFVIIDHGKVTNATRQCLYTAEDIRERKDKVFAACNAIKKVNPVAQVTPVKMSVPMPGHFITDEDICERYNNLRNVMMDCDSVFLLTDSKESRWLPSFIAAEHTRNNFGSSEKGTLEEVLSENKTTERLKGGPIVISGGVAFDGWMVIRHGYGTFYGGCYFCGDVQSPSDSISGRPMDETCTIVKPGSISTCAAAAVELLISLTQHPDGPQAKYGSCSCLGEVPHAVRMSLSDLSLQKIYIEESETCICCSRAVIKHFRSNPIEFLKKALRNPSFLSNISGLDKTLGTLSNYSAKDVIVESGFVVL